MYPHCSKKLSYYQLSKNSKASYFRGVDLLGNAQKTVLQARDLLVKAQACGDWRIRFCSIKTLSRLKDCDKADIMPTFVSALSDNHWCVRWAAVRAIADTGKDSIYAFASLIKCLADESFYVRKAAAEAIGRLGRKAELALPALTHALDDESMNVRTAARMAIARIRKTGSFCRPKPCRGALCRCRFRVVDTVWRYRVLVR